MRSLSEKAILLLVVCLCNPSFLVFAQQIPSLGSAHNYNALANKKITSTGSAVVNAGLGVANGTISGFTPGAMGRVSNVNNNAAKQALQDARQAFNKAFILPSGSVKPSHSLSSITFSPGVHKVSGDAMFSGNVILNDGGKPEPIFVFQIDGNLTIADQAVLDYANKVAANNILWVVNGNLTIGKNAIAEGSFISKGKITIADGAKLKGRVISLEDEVLLSKAVLNAPSDLMIEIVMSKSSTGTEAYHHNEEATFYFSVTNKGPSDEDEAYVRTIAFIGELLSYSSSRSGTTFTAETGEWKIGKIAYNETVTLTLKVRLNRSGFGFVRAVVEGYNIDEYLLNNSTILNYCVLLPETGSITGPTEVCRGETYIYSIAPVSGATKFIWSVTGDWQFTQLNPTSISVKPGSGPGQITVKPSNICGKGPVQMLDVTLLPDTPVKPGSISGAGSVCVGTEELTYKISPVENATSYTWVFPEGWSIKTGQGTTEVTATVGTSSGSVEVVASNSCGASEAQVLPVYVATDVPELNVAIHGDMNTCIGNNTTFEIDATPGAIGYVWTVPSDWIIKSGQNTNSVIVTVGNTGGTITVKAANACGLSTAQSITITPTFSTTDAPGEIKGILNSCGNEKGLVYTVDPVASAKSYSWTVPAGWVITSGQGTTSITANASASGGEIAVRAVNECGPSVASTKAIQPTPDAPAMPEPITGKQYGCVNSTTTYSISDVSGAKSYTWAVPADWTILSGQGTKSITVNTGSEKGKVTVRGNNDCGAGDARELEVVPQTGVPAAITTLNGPKEVCQDEPGAVFSVTPVEGAIDYTWTVPTGWVITSGQGTSLITITPSAAEGAVTVKATNDCGIGAETSMAVKVVPSPPAKPDPISGFISVCANQKDLVYTIAPVATASSYYWTVTNGWTVVSEQGATSITVNASSVGATISVQAVNACGVTSETQLTTIITNTPPARPAAITGITIPCVGKEYVFSIHDVPTALSYTWAVPTDWQIISEDGTSIRVVAGAIAGNVSVAAVNNCGAGEVKEFPVKPAYEKPSEVTISYGGPDVCSNSTVVFKAEGGVNIASYVWAIPTGWSILSGQGTAELTVRTNATAGAVSLIATNDCGSTTFNKTVDMATIEPVAPGPIANTGALCVGASSIFTVSPVAGATSYNWEVPADWKILSGQRTTSVQVQTGNTAGTIKVYAVNACGSSSSASTLEVAPLLDGQLKPIIINGPATDFCEKESNLTYSVSAEAGATFYNWNVPAGWVITSGQGTTEITATAGVAGGEISVEIVNACGKSTMQALPVKPNNVPEQPASIVGPADPCNSSTVAYSVEGIAGLAYNWVLPKDWVLISGQGTSEVTVKPTATAGTVKVVAINNCGASAMVELPVKPVSSVPTAPATIRVAASVCSGSTLTYTIDAASGASSYEWALPEEWTFVSGQGTATATVMAGGKAGTISVVAKNGCGQSLSTKMDVAPQKLVAPVVILDRSTPCSGLVYEVEPVEGAKNYNWMLPAGWAIISGEGTTKITVLPGEGTGTISVAAHNGTCTSESVSIVPDKALAASNLIFPNVFSPNSDGNNDTWVVQNLEKYTYNDLTIINRWGNEVFKARRYQNNWAGDGLSEGTYYYIVRARLCDGTDQVFKGYVMIVR